MKALARLMFVAPLTKAMGYVAMTLTESGIGTPATLVPAALTSVT